MSVQCLVVTGYTTKNLDLRITEFDSLAGAEDAGDVVFNGEKKNKKKFLLMIKSEVGFQLTQNFVCLGTCSHWL